MLAVLIIIAVVLAIIVVMLWLGGVAGFAYVRTVVEHVAEYQRDTAKKLDDIKAEVDKKGSVTDPFKAATVRKSVGASSRHIIVPKSPDQIRNENYEAIKEGGKKYGHDS